MGKHFVADAVVDPLVVFFGQAHGPRFSRLFAGSGYEAVYDVFPLLAVCPELLGQVFERDRKEPVGLARCLRQRMRLGTLLRGLHPSQLLQPRHPGPALGRRHWSPGGGKTLCCTGRLRAGELKAVQRSPLMRQHLGSLRDFKRARVALATSP